MSLTLLVYNCLSHTCTFASLTHMKFLFTRRQNGAALRLQQASPSQTDDMLLMNFFWQVLTVSCHARTGTTSSDVFKFSFALLDDVQQQVTGKMDKTRIRLAVVVSIMFSQLLYCA